MLRMGEGKGMDKGGGKREKEGERRGGQESRVEIEVSEGGLEGWARMKVGKRQKRRASVYLTIAFNCGRDSTMQPGPLNFYF